MKKKGWGRRKTKLRSARSKKWKEVIGIIFFMGLCFLFQCFMFYNDTVETKIHYYVKDHTVIV